MKWFVGNLHCHTNRSDGRATPAQVGDYYRIQKHDFLGVSDHNRFTPPADYAEQAGLLGIPCCEYSAEMCCHVLSVGVTEAIAPRVVKRSKPRSKTAALQEGITKTVKAGGIPVVCHPNWNWTLTAEDILPLKGCNHFEICNAAPDCNAYPLPGFAPAETLWDTLLTAGQRYFGLANDDAHDYYSVHKPRSPRGGIGFNVVRIRSLTERNVVEAIRKGRFYASTGILLDSYKVTKSGISLKLHRQTNERTVFQFFGEGGRELSHVIGEEAQYKFKGTEGYVRVRIASTAGLWAWTQPVFLDDPGDAIRWTGAK